MCCLCFCRRSACRARIASFLSAKFTIRLSSCLDESIRSASDVDQMCCSDVTFSSMYASVLYPWLIMIALNRCNVRRGDRRIQARFVPSAPLLTFLIGGMNALLCFSWVNEARELPAENYAVNQAPPGPECFETFWVFTLHAFNSGFSLIWAIKIKGGYIVSFLSI